MGAGGMMQKPFRSTDQLKQKAKSLTENSKNLDEVNHHQRVESNDY